MTELIPLVKEYNDKLDRSLPPTDYATTSVEKMMGKLLVLGAYRLGFNQPHLNTDESTQDEQIMSWYNNGKKTRTFLDEKIPTTSPDYEPIQLQHNQHIDSILGEVAMHMIKRGSI